MLSLKLSERGIYMARLFRNGRWKLIQVDDLFPCTDQGELVYTQAVDGQLLVPILEKAMAKVNTTYENSAFLSLLENLSALTGFPCEKHDLDLIRSLKQLILRDEKKNELWKNLREYKKGDCFSYIMGAKCVSSEDKGLKKSSYYSILNALELTDDAGKTHQLVQLGNLFSKYLNFFFPYFIFYLIICKKIV
jgi:hypothetical protein